MGTTKQNKSHPKSTKQYFLLEERDRLKNSAGGVQGGSANAIASNRGISQASQSSDKGAFSASQDDKQETSHLKGVHGHSGSSHSTGNKQEGLELCVQSQGHDLIAVTGFSGKTGQQDEVGELLFMPPDEKEVNESFYSQLEVPSQLQALVLVGDFNPPDICLKSKMARHTPSRRLLQSIEDNFLTQVVEYPEYLDLRPYTSHVAGEPLLYSLYAVVVVEYPEYLDLRPYTSHVAGEPLLYSLYAVVVVEYPEYLDLRPYTSHVAGEPLLYSLYAVVTNLKECVSVFLHRKQLKSTSKYIYQTLFVNGENSDVKICALGEEWNLHKIYLCQSGYFSSMFSGAWKESSMNIIELEIPDPNIDTEALQVAFGSLYRDDVLIKPSRVVALLAAACMLQLDDLIQQCGETMKETINAETVCGYYNSAATYGLDSVKKKCLEWLLNNLMPHQSVALFKDLSINLMKQLISSSDLLVVQVEMDVYTALKKWMFLQLVPTWNGSLKQLLTEADAWFARRRRDFEDDVAFLESEQGNAFLSVFTHLRLQYIISDLASARIIERDSLMPSEWLSSVYKQQWLAVLRAEQGNDIGPQEINKEELEGNSMRCGRKLAEGGHYCWRWTGFNFGFDLLVTYTNGYIIFKRNTLDQPCSGSVSLQPRRNIAFRLRVTSFDSSGKVTFSRTTGYQILTFQKDQEQIVMNLDRSLLTFPLYIFCNFLYTSPEKTTDSEALPDNSET
ncbi:germ cell-less protein-like 1 [Phalacrocorax carbo]|uniref:germ cell-less protein-like 1 n=1 Tax=Phalacrocorax carbo TaxID=9209 RepID=UPI003119E9A1